MVDGPNDGTSHRLTVSSAATVLEGLFSDESENTSEPRETNPTRSAPSESEPDADAAPAAESEPDAPAETESDEADEQPDEEPAQPATHRVKIDGEEVEVTLDELLKGYSRTSDYTRKTQQLAEQRKAQEAEFSGVKQERLQYATALKQLETLIEQATPAEPDWDTLRTQHPDEFPTAWANWQRHKEQVAAIRAERESAEQKVLADHSEAMRQTIEAERAKLLAALPAWKDADVAKRERTKLAEYAESVGFTPEELGSVYDHRALVLLNKARLWDEAQRAKPAVTRKLEEVRVATPGTRTNRKPVSETTKAKQRLAKTGRVTDAAAVLLTMLD